MELRRLFPDPATTTVDEAASGLGFSERAPADRPFIAVNMVSSADGKATLAGRTAPMSAPVDRELFHHLRAQADGILVGAGTVRIEGYGRVTKTDELQAKREREDGQEAEHRSPRAYGANARYAKQDNAAGSRRWVRTSAECMSIECASTKRGHPLTGRLNDRG